MKKQQTPAQTAYEAAVDSLQKFCDKETELMPTILDDVYPIRVQFIPKPQLTVFGNENIDENGEVNDLTVTVGLSTDVKSTLRFKMNSKLLKKLIKLAEAVGSLYYHAFREEQGERITPAYPVKRAMDGAEDVPCCPRCERHVFRPLGKDKSFCSHCGQAIEWKELESPEFKESLEKLRKLCERKEGEQ